MKAKLQDERIANNVLENAGKEAACFSVYHQQ